MDSGWWLIDRKAGPSTRTEVLGRDDNSTATRFSTPELGMALGTSGRQRWKAKPSGNSQLRLRPARQKTSLDGIATNAPALDATVVHRTCEQSLKLMSRRRRGLVQRKPGSQSWGKNLRVGSRFQQVEYARRATPEVGSRCLSVLVTHDLRSGAPVRLVSHRITGLESSRHRPANGFMHQQSVRTYADKW